MLRRGLVFFFLLLSGVSALWSDPFPGNQRGFDAEKVFQIGEIDHVNVLNGNLALTLPIGGSYPVGGGLSYSLTLVYNGKLWDFQQDALNQYSQSWPVRTSNAGLGWSLSFGRLLSRFHPHNQTGRWLYISPDGGEHLFYPTLHEGESDTAPGESSTLYTRDGSYLRLKRLGSYDEIESPDGSIRRFDLDGRLIQLRDRHGDAATANRVNIAYLSNPERWEISDSAGRLHKVFLSAVPYYGLAVSRVELSAFGGGTAGYDFAYTNVDLPRVCPDNDPDTNAITVPLLTGVTLPDRSSYSMPAADHHTDTTQGCLLPGLIKGMTLPSLGRLAWTYLGYSFPADSGERPWRTLSAGVGSRTETDPVTGVSGTWTYTPALNPIPGPAVPAREAVRTVKTPLGDKTEHFFSVALDPSPTGWSRYEYGLPFTRNTGDGTGRSLSSKVWDCAASGANCSLRRSTYVRYERDQLGADSLDLTDYQNRNRRAAAERTVYEDDGGMTADLTRSDFDGLGNYRTSQTGGGFPGSNVRIRHSYFNPGQGTYTGDPATSSFTMVPVSSPWVLGTFPYAWDAEGGATALAQYCYQPGTPKVVRQRVHRQDGGMQDMLDLVATFDLDARGNVIAESYYGGDLQGGIQVGGDNCSMPLPAPEYQLNHSYTAGVVSRSWYTGHGFNVLERGIDAGTRLTSWSRDTAGLQTDYEYDLLGRLTWSKPPTGHGGYSEYVYSTATAASAASAAAGPSVHIRNRGNSKTAAVLSQSRLEFDGFGRLQREERWLPGTGPVARRDTFYDVAGNRASVSEWETGTPAKKTQFLLIDPFGRPGKIRPADVASPDPALSFAHDVDLVYTGVRQVERTVRIGLTAGAAETPVKTTEVYDRHGRLYQVTEPSGAAGALETTTYGYDVGNRLTSVATGAQTRTFAYDRAGLLLWENHPEKTANIFVETPSDQQRDVSYPSYDSRGHLRRKVDGDDDLSFAYDTAERLTRVSETGGNPLKDFVYGTANGTNNHLKGKLHRQSRYNYVTLNGSPFTVHLRETFTYGGRDGRVSKRELESFVNTATAPQESFVQTFTYDPLGNLKQLTYPECTHQACIDQLKQLPWTVENVYDNGLLTSVGIPGTSDYYARLAYHPNLLVSEVAHRVSGATTIRDLQYNDPSALRRPSSLQAQTPAGTVRWSSGTYTYDGAGNIRAIGNSAFNYDWVSRLTSGTVDLAPTGAANPRTQSYAYDTFGNIQSITTNTSQLLTPTSSATNRLNGAGVVYDASGNLTEWSSNKYDYDPLGNLWRYRTAAGKEWLYLYTADDERVWSFAAGQNTSAWTLRDLNGKLLREYANTGGTWSRTSDSIYRGDLLLAAETSTGLRHYSLDHLGTPRLITDSFGTQAAYHVYYPFGQEATAFNQDTIRTKFTGHERDLADLAGTGDDLDYMHARFYSPLTARFLSIDPVLVVEKAVAEPQDWNRYAYVENNPTGLTDPTGKCPFCIAVVLGAIGGVLSADYANAPAPGDSIYGNDDSSGRMIVGAALNAGAVLAARSILGSGTRITEPKGDSKEPALRPDVAVSGGRGGQNVKTATAPPNSIVRGSEGRVFQTNEKGQIIADITKDRVKPVQPGTGFGKKRAPTRQELDWLAKMAKAINQMTKK